MKYFYEFSAETNFFLKLSNVPFIIFMRTRFLTNQMQPVDCEYIPLTQELKYQREIQSKLCNHFIYNLYFVISGIMILVQK